MRLRSASQNLVSGSIVPSMCRCSSAFGRPSMKVVTTTSRCRCAVPYRSTGDNSGGDYGYILGSTAMSGAGMECIRALISEAEIAARVEALAAEIAQRRPGDFVIVGLLKGAAMFVADLVRALYRAGACPEIEFMRLSSYGLAKVSSGEVHLLSDIPTDLAGRRVLLVD